MSYLSSQSGLSDSQPQLIILLLLLNTFCCGAMLLILFHVGTTLKRRLYAMTDNLSGLRAMISNMRASGCGEDDLVDVAGWTRFGPTTVTMSRADFDWMRNAKLADHAPASDDAGATVGPVSSREAKGEP